MKIKTDVIFDFQGSQYVREIMHMGNTTIKRNFPVWRG